MAPTLHSEELSLPGQILSPRARTAPAGDGCSALAAELLCGGTGRRDKRLRALQVSRTRRSAPQFYQSKVNSKLPEATERAIDAELDNFGTVLPSCRLFWTKAGREPLRRCLVALTAADPEVGFNHDLALVTAGMLSVIDKEEDAFLATREVMKRFRMRGYFLYPQAELKGSVAALWRMVAMELPVVAAAFEHDDCADRPIFRNLARAWVCSLFMCSCGRQSFAEFVALLHGLMCSKDELEPLHVAFAALRRHEEDFKKVSSKAELEDLTKRLHKELRVDAELLRLITGRHDEVADRARGSLAHLVSFMGPRAGDIREFVRGDTVGFGPNCAFNLQHGQEIEQRCPVVWCGRYRLRITLDGLVWQAPNADMIHRTPIVCGVVPAMEDGSVPPPGSGAGAYGFLITRTTNRALWGVAASDSGTGGVPEFFVGCLSRKVSFDLLLMLAPGSSSLEFIYNGVTLGRIAWTDATPVRFVVSAPNLRDLRAENFLTDHAQKHVSRMTVGAMCKKVSLTWVCAKEYHNTFEAMLPKMFISTEDQPNFIFRDKSQTQTGFDFPGIGPGQEVEQQKGLIGAGTFRLKVRIMNLVWGQGNNAACPFRTEDRLLTEYQGQDMALFVGMRFVEYFGIYIHRIGDGKFGGWVSSDSEAVFEIDAPGGNIELTFELQNDPHTNALVSDSRLKVFHEGKTVADVVHVVSSLIPASFRVRNGILVRTINSERHVYGSSCSLKFEWESLQRDEVLPS